jgi:hypothetical protein
VLLAALGAATAVTSHAAVITPYTWAGTFNASAIVGGAPTYIENFDNNTALFTTFTLTGGVFVQNGVTRQVMNNSFRDQIDDGPGAAQSTAIGLIGGGSMTAFGAYFDLGIANFGQGIVITIDFGGGNTQVVTTLAGFIGFYGFTSDTPFVSVTLTSQAGFASNMLEDLILDDIVIEASNGPNPSPNGVPEPATFGMMGLALAGLGLGIAKRKARK